MGQAIDELLKKASAAPAATQTPTQPAGGSAVQAILDRISTNSPSAPAVPGGGGASVQDLLNRAKTTPPRSPVVVPPPPKIKVTDVIKEVPGATVKVAKGVISFFTRNWQNLVKTAGTNVGEAGAYALDKNVREQVSGAPIKTLTDFQTKLIQRLKDTPKGSPGHERIKQQLKDLTTEIGRVGNVAKEILPGQVVNGEIQTTGQGLKRIGGQAIGAFLEAAPYAKLPGGSIASKVLQAGKGGSTSTIGKMASQGAKLGGVYGAGFGASAALQENKTAGQTLKQALVGGATGAAIGAVSSVALGVLARKLAAKVPVAKDGEAVLSPNVLNDFKEQAAKQVEFHDPQLASVVRSVDLKGVTTVPEAEQKLLDALPDDASPASKQAVKEWAKSFMGMIYQREVGLPADAQIAADKAAATPETQVFRSKGVLGSGSDGAFGKAVYVTPDQGVADMYNRATSGEGIQSGKMKIGADEILDLSTQRRLTAFTNKAIKAYPLGAEKTGESIQLLARDLGYKAIAGDEVTGLAILDTGKLSGIATPKTDTGQLAERFAQRVQKAADTNPELAQKLDDMNIVYDRLNNKETLANAVKQIDTIGEDKMVRILQTNAKPTAESNTAAMVLIKRMEDAGRIQDALDLTANVSKLNCEAGQTTQALAMWSRLTPEGVLRYAQNTVDDYNQQLITKLGNKVPADKLLKLTPEVAQDLIDRATTIQGMEDGLAKQVETAKMLSQISDQVPSTFLRKVSTVQIFGQLLNPKTLIRNLVGNTGFQALENVTSPVRTGVDVITSAFTGERTASMGGGQLGAQIEGAKAGLEIGKLEAQYGINLDDAATKFDLPQAKTFKGGVGGALEKALDWGLRVPDKVAYQSAFEQKVAELQSLVDSGKSSMTADEIASAAHEYGLYRTFQDISGPAYLAQKTKSALNFGKEFGMGDVVLKYPKTPGNLLARALDYSPTGFLNTLFQGFKPLIGKITDKPMPFDQAKFVDSFSRALVGTGAVAGTGYALQKSGIITSARKQTDKDVSALQQTEGVGPYRINVSALKRFVTSGFKKQAGEIKAGDHLVSFDWFQPQAVMLAIGARMADTKDKTTSMTDTIINSLAEGVNTIVEQPLLRGVQRLFDPNTKGGIMGKVLDIATQAPASFIPTFFSQVNQLLDNKQREVYSNIWWKEMLNTMAAKVPGLAQTVPPRINVFGREQERYQDGSNSVFNVLFNPAFISTFNPTPMSKQILDLYDKTGESGQFPSVVGKTQKINGQNVDLNAEQYQKLQTYVGAMTTKMFLARIGQPDWNKLPDLDKVKELANIASDVRAAGKIKILGDKPAKPSHTVQGIVAQPMPKVNNVTDRREVSSESEKRAKSGVINFLKDYGQALKTDPTQTLRAIFGPERLRKVRGDAVILERKVDIADLDLGDPNSAIDHIIPLGMGGTNNLANYQILDNKTKAKKDRVEKYLINLLDQGKIKKKEAQTRIMNWRQEYEKIISGKQVEPQAMAPKTTVQSVKAQLANIFGIPTAQAVSLPPAQAKVSMKTSGNKAVDTVAQRIAQLEGFNKQNTLAQRNNNPGNLRFVGQPGASKGEKSYAKFKTLDAGWSALHTLIRNYANRGVTLRQFVYKYAPPSENNSEAYLRNLASTLGVSANAKLSSIIKETDVRALFGK